MTFSGLFVFFLVLIIDTRGLFADYRERGYDGNDPTVCCVNQTSSTVTPTTTTTTTTTTMKTIMKEDQENIIAHDVMNHSNLHLLDHQICGPILEQKILGGNRTGLFQYPWMALITYDTGRPNPEFRCSGTIISTRYILTAAHCVTMLPSNFRLIGVRVGDYDISKERDCDTDKEGREIQCIEKYQDFTVESVHFHPGYRKKSLQNDIALIKLNGSINFRPQSVKPICLPFGTSSTLHQKKVIVTGWGATEYHSHSQALLQAKLSLITNEECKEIYKRYAQISYKQLCTIGNRNVDFCLGDSGGPLQRPSIYNDRSVRMVQYGVVSYGLRQCGIEGFPGVSTKVAYYMKWILDNMTD